MSAEGQSDLSSQVKKVCDDWCFPSFSHPLWPCQLSSSEIAPTMALSTRIRVPASQKNPTTFFVRCRSTSAIASSSIVDAKSRVREHARQISRSSVAKATPTPSMYVGAFHLPFNIQLTPNQPSQSYTKLSTDPYAKQCPCTIYHQRARTSSECSTGFHLCWAIWWSNFSRDDASTWR